MKNVVVFGTFDLLHPGHRSFLKQAKKLGNHLIAVVARDINVAKAKGIEPVNKEKSRAAALRKLKLADKVILGSKTHNFFRTLRSNRVDLVALGYDQRPTLRNLKKQLRRHRLANIEVRRLRPLRPELYKSSRLREKLLVS